MIRALIFDFYSVWVPDKFESLVMAANDKSKITGEQSKNALEQYYAGSIDLEHLIEFFRVSVNMDISLADFKLDPKDISPRIIDFFRTLHMHFFKLGVVGNMGRQDYDLLLDIDRQFHQFEVISCPLEAQVPLLSKDMFVNVLRAIGEPPQNCILVSGHQEFLDFAASFGLQTVAYEGFPKLEKTIMPLLHLIS